MGFTTLFFTWIIKPAVEPQQIALYHWSGPARNFFLPSAIDFLIPWLVLVCLLLLAHTPGRLRAFIWGSLLFFIPWFILVTLHVLGLTPNTHQLDRILFLGAILGALLLVVRWRPAFAPRFERIVDTASTILVFAGCFGVFLLAQLAFRAWQAHRFLGPAPLHQRVAATAQPHRILWIVFDELSYQQTFENRFPGLKLPAFDAFASTATAFTHAEPFDIHTEDVIPGLFAGEPFDQMRVTSTVDLSVHNKTTGKWEPFRQHNTVFQDALNDGYSTAVVGWYNPYCRILPSVLDSCYWSFLTAFNHMLPSNSLLANMLGPLKVFAGRLLVTAPGPVYFYGTRRLHIPPKKPTLAQYHIDEYTDLDNRSLALLRDPSYSFVFLHLPVPHPVGIYNRSTGRFTTAYSAYVDNLALADKCLAGIRQTLEQTGQWDSSTVVVMGDHGWRTLQMWKPTDV
jgi:hypothetical protein